MTSRWSTEAPEHWQEEFKYVILNAGIMTQPAAPSGSRQKCSAMSSGEMTFSDYDADLQHEAGDNAAPVNG